VVVTADYPGLYVPDDPTTANRLVQSHYWLTRDDETRRLSMVHVADMTPNHRAHLLRWLRANAWTMRAHVHRAIVDDSLYLRITLLERDRLIGRLMSQDPTDWIESTPLVQKLVHLVPRAPALPPRFGDRWRRRRTR